MKKSELLALLARLELHPSRKLGQNFLIDDNMLDAMVRASAPVAGESVLEIGPGTGVLTRRLLAAGCRVTAVELDHRLAAYLRSELGEQENFRLIEGDACKQDYQELMGDEPFRCIANLPYSCGSVFLAVIAALSNPPTELYVLLQKEMGDRLTATIGTKEYGSLTCRLQWLYAISLVRNVPQGVFFPPPEVMSAYIRLKRLPEIPAVALRQRAALLVNTAFSQRRKKITGLLSKYDFQQPLASLLDEMQISPDSRAENLTPAQYLQLAEKLKDDAR